MFNRPTSPAQDHSSFTNSAYNALKSSKNSPEVHVWRMRKAVGWSIILQFILFFVLNLLLNVNIFHPITWLSHCFRTIVNLSVWIKLIIMVIIIYIQGEICKKDYISDPVYYKSRFQKMRHVFCLRNFLILLFHMITGFTVFWTYSSIPGSAFEAIYKPCLTSSSHQSEYCLDECKLFLLLGGLWLGIYYFITDFIFGSRCLIFPLIQQYKFYRVKAALKESIKQSLKNSIIPIALFVLMYFIYGGFIRSKIIAILMLSPKIDEERDPLNSFQGIMNIQILFTFWLFSSIFIVALKIMKLLFNVYLTEHAVFPVTENMSLGNSLSLIESMKMSKVPIIQYLGYLDLFILSSKFPQRRAEVFTLSHPGGHPHSWNNICRECTFLIKNFTNSLNEALEQFLNPDGKKEVNKLELQRDVGSFHFHSHNIRKLASPLNKNAVNDVNAYEYRSAVEIGFNNFKSWLNSKIALFMKKPYISYFFLESPDSRINFLLLQSQPVIWAVESLSHLAAASLTEDQYGIVQKDLGMVITITVELKQALDKLFKQNLIVKKSFANDPIEIQMKYLLRTSVKRSLYKISATFGPYIKDLNLPVDVEMLMNNFMAFREV